MALERLYNVTYQGILADLPATLPGGSFFIAKDTKEVYAYDENDLPFKFSVIQGEIPEKTSDLINDGNGDTEIIFGVEFPIPFITKEDLPNVVPITDFVSKANGGRFGGPIYVGDIVGGRFDGGVYIEDNRFFVKPKPCGADDRYAVQVYTDVVNVEGEDELQNQIAFSVKPNVIDGFDPLNSARQLSFQHSWWPDPDQEYFDNANQVAFNGDDKGVTIFQLGQPSTIMTIGYSFFGSAVEKGDNLAIRGNAKTAGTHRAGKVRILDIDASLDGSDASLRIDSNGFIVEAPNIAKTRLDINPLLVGYDLIANATVTDGEILIDCNLKLLDNGVITFTDNFLITTLPPFLRFFQSIPITSIILSESGEVLPSSAQVRINTSNGEIRLFTKDSFNAKSIDFSAQFKFTSLI